MKTVMTISIEEDIKREFQEFAREMWTNMTNLLSMFMKSAIRKREISFSCPSYDIEFENFSKNNLEELVNNEKIIKNTEKMEKLLSNV